MVPFLTQAKVERAITGTQIIQNHCFLGLHEPISQELKEHIAELEAQLQAAEIRAELATTLPRLA